MRDLGFTLALPLAERARSMEESGYSVVYVGWAGRVHAVMSLDDTLHPEARATIEALRRLGLRVVLLTGDLAPAARRIAAMVGIEDVQAGLSPEAKLEALTRYRAKHEIVAMVGDGLNDGPVLAKADVGIAVGSATDLARETAALVLPKEGLWILPWAITVARKGWSTTLTNLMWAFGYNLIALALAMAGVLQPVLAAAVMASSSLLLVVNSLRLSQIPDPALPGSDRRAPDIEPDEIRRGLGVPAMVASASERR
jgi:Cu2+-exporting ATPase